MSVEVTFGWGFSQRVPAACVLVHGGAGARGAETLAAEIEGCARASEQAAAILRGGASALDAVQRAVEALEDDPCFNAGTGGSLTEQGELELDASIMEGAALRAGAVCCLPPYRHPVAIARAALEDGRHVLYAAAGAAAFARRSGFLPADPASMITARSKEQLVQVLAGRAQPRGGNTVGAVARDRHGHLAAATSTGGMTAKRAGRVGDSPLIGAGTYADDTRCAASATGPGEGIIRVSLCASVAAAAGAGLGAEAAARAGIATLAQRVNGEGGVIVVARDGSLGLARSTACMPWAAVWQDGAERGG